MGSGGMVVLDDRDCMVDMARYFLRFTQDQSCGKCTLCRIGTRRMRDILDRICSGKGPEGRPRIARTTQPHRRGRQHLRAGPHRAQPGALHAALLPRGVRGPPGRPLSGGQVQGLDRLSRERGLHRLHALRPEVSGRRHPHDALRPAYDRHAEVYALRHVPAGLSDAGGITWNNATPHHRPTRNRSAGRIDDPRCGRAVGHRDPHALLLAAVRAVDLVPGLPGEALAQRPPGAGLCHAGGRRHAGRKRDRRGSCGPPQHAGAAPQRPPGRLRGPLLVRLPGADEHPADAPPDRGGRTPRGPDHGQGRHRPAGRAGADLPGPLREGLPPWESRRRGRDLRTQADRGRRRSGLGGALFAAVPARVGQAGGDCRRRAGRLGGRLLSGPRRPCLHDLRRHGYAGRHVRPRDPRGETAPRRARSARSPRSCGWASKRN